MNLQQLQWQLSALSVFKNLREDPVIENLQELLGYLIDLAPATEFAGEGIAPFWQNQAITAYANMTAALYEETTNLSEYIRTRLFEDENAYVKLAARGKKPPAKLTEALKTELATLQQVADLKSKDLQKAMKAGDVVLPDWNNARIDLLSEYLAHAEDIHKTGYGIYARYRAFTLVDGKLVPVVHPDEQDLSDLFGYERERNQIVKNTEALLAGKKASNILLYGDAGTGKSSTIKAVAKAYADQGLRLVEVRKDQLFQIPDLLKELTASPLKFILFIDDLSFNKNDDNFSALKAILEGSITASGENVVVYATSNRRHLVKERMSDREGDELFTNDTLQEISSLSARFGLTITFQRPDKEAYLAIVKELARAAKLKMPEEELFTKAEAQAIRFSGRTPRVAKQFVELLAIGIDPTTAGKEQV